MGWPGSRAKVEFNSCDCSGTAEEKESMTEHTTINATLESVIRTSSSIRFLGLQVSHKMLRGERASQRFTATGKGFRLIYRTKEKRAR
jgi:hypothetical protein